eukprot:scaffold648959_cov36-Prasinocladus_malaysianus.AAC.2
MIAAWQMCYPPRISRAGKKREQGGIQTTCSEHPQTDAASSYCKSAASQAESPVHADFLHISYILTAQKT